MMKIGIRGHDLKAFNNVNDIKKEYENYGFDGLQLVIKKSFKEGYNYFENIDDLKKLDVILLGAYFNPIHPDMKKVEEGKEYFKNQIKLASKLGVSYVGTETGSLMGDPWDYYEGNHEIESFNKIMHVFSELCQKGKEFNVNILLEGAYAHVCYSPKRVKEAIDYLKSDNLFITVDIFNFLNINNYMNNLEIFEECLYLFKDKIKVIHLKDFIYQNNKLIQVALGEGLMKYNEIIPIIKKELPNVNLVFEDISNGDIKKSYDFIINLIKK